MKTIVLDGIEYVLIPRDQLSALFGESTPTLSKPEPAPAKSPEPEPPAAEPSALTDFMGVEDSTIRVIKSHPSPMTTVTEPDIRIVDPTLTERVEEAQPKPYSYRDRFLKKQLLPNDVMGFPGFNPNDIHKFQDLPEFEMDAKRPASKQLFYGAGIEIDNPSMV